MQKYAHLNRDTKMGPFIYQSRKNGSVIYSFLGKGGLLQVAGLKGAIRAAHPYHVIYRELPPSPRDCGCTLCQTVNIPNFEIALPDSLIPVMCYIIPT